MPADIHGRGQVTDCVAMTVGVADNALICDIGGELDIATAPDVRAALLAAVDEVSALTVVIFDLTRMTLLSATGIHTLMDVARACRGRSIEVRAVMDSTNPVSRSMAFGELTATLPVFDTVAEAVDSVVPFRRDVSARNSGGADRDQQFASFAHSLLDTDSVGEVLSRVVHAAEAILPKADLASITLRDSDGSLHTPV